MSKPCALAINLGSTKGYTVSEVLAACEEVTERNVPRKDAARRPGDSPGLLAAAEEADKVLGWKSSYDLKAMIETAWKWEQNRKF
jgi:UDP-glucose 4-epimerase